MSFGLMLSRMGKVVGRFRNRKKILLAYYNDRYSDLMELNIDPVLKTWASGKSYDWFQVLEAEKELKKFLVLASMHYLSHRKSDRARQGFDAEYITCEGELLDLWKVLILHTSVYRDVGKILNSEIDYWPEGTDQRISQPRAYHNVLSLWSELFGDLPENSKFWPSVTEICEKWAE